MSELATSYMDRAFELAREALSVGEVPVGCVLCHQDHGIIGEGRNRVNETKNATRHAEFEAIDSALLWIEKNKIESYAQVFAKTDVWVNVEPCIQCAGALQMLGFARVYYGCANERFGGCGSVLDVCAKDQRFRPLELHGGIRSNEAIQLLKEFYRCENPNAPNPKSKEGRK